MFLHMKIPTETHTEHSLQPAPYAVLWVKVSDIATWTSVT